MFLYSSSGIVLAIEHANGMGVMYRKVKIFKESGRLVSADMNGNIYALPNELPRMLMMAGMCVIEVDSPATSSSRNSLPCPLSDEETAKLWEFLRLIMRVCTLFYERSDEYVLEEDLDTAKDDANTAEALLHKMALEDTLSRSNVMLARRLIERLLRWADMEERTWLLNLDEKREADLLWEEARRFVDVLRNRTAEALRASRAGHSKG